MSKICAFYGSLKSSGYNYQRFFGQKLIKSLTLNGFELFNLGPFPAAAKGNGTIQTELHEVSNDAFNSILRMEQGAGYHLEELQLDNIKVNIFLMDKEDLVNCKKIESGNWN